MIGTARAELLSDDDLVELTGVEQPAAQARVLREHGLKPIMRRDGKPRVTWSAVTAAQLERTKAEPNFDAAR